MSAVLVTGATGFVGTVLCGALAKEGYTVRGAVRNCSLAQKHGESLENITRKRRNEPKTRVQIKTKDFAVVGDIGPETNWSEALRGIDTVVHLAARVHIMRETASDPLKEFRRVNVSGTANLARAAAEAGVRRLVYLSSIKVNGEETGQAPFTERDVPQPKDPYAISKWEAEQVLYRVAKDTGLEIAILRPPLVYGPAVKGNLLRILNWIYRGIPLPFKKIDNRRSLISIDNLASFIVRCVEHSNVAGQTFLVSDGEDLSTAELIMRLGAALGCRPRLFSVSPRFLRWAGKVAGREDMMRRILGSLQIDSRKARDLLGWSPPFSVDTGLSQTAKWYLSSCAKNYKHSL